MADLAISWETLTLISKLYLVCLLVCAAYTTVFLGRSLFTLRRRVGVAVSIEMATRLENVRQANTLVFLLSGVDLALETMAMI